MGKTSKTAVIPRFQKKKQSGRSCCVSLCCRGLIWLGRGRQDSGATSRKTLVLPIFGGYRSITCYLKWPFIALGLAWLKLTAAPLILVWLKSVSNQDVAELVLPARKKNIYLRIILPRITGVIMVIINGNKLISSTKDGLIVDDLLIWQMLFLFWVSLCQKQQWTILSVHW